MLKQAVFVSLMAADDSARMHYALNITQERVKSMVGRKNVFIPTAPMYQSARHRNAIHTAQDDGARRKIAIN
ncbi:unnamed protein product [Aphanomyces euteiches]